MNASGTLDPLAARDAGVPVHLDVAAVVTKTITPLPREGNPPPRVAETPSGLLNSIGLANPGVDAFVASLPELVALGRPLVVSIGGFSVDDYVRLARALARAAGIVALELNISCPNVETGCISIGSDPAETTAVVRALSRRDLAPAVGEALAERGRRRRDRAGRRRRGCRRACVREHTARHGDRSVVRRARCSARRPVG